MTTLPGWTGADGAASEAWNRIILGGITLPGVWKVTGLEAGIDVDVKKSKGKDGPTTKDNGVDVPRFNLEGILTEAHWPEWLGILPAIHPRRIGRARQPVSIEHPEPNALGINQVRIVKIKGDPPTARAGKRYTIECMEWFSEQKDANDSKSNSARTQFDKAALDRLSTEANANLLHALATAPPDTNPDDEDNVLDQIFRHTQSIFDPP